MSMRPLNSITKPPRRMRVSYIAPLIWTRHAKTCTHTHTRARARPV